MQACWHHSNPCRTAINFPVNQGFIGDFQQFKQIQIVQNDQIVTLKGHQKDTMKPRKLVKNGKTMWLLQWTESGTRRRRFFDSQREAEKEAKRMELDQGRVGQSWATVPDSARVEMMAAWERSQRGGYRLLEACERYEKSQPRFQTNPEPLSKAVEAYIASKEKQNLKPYTLELLRPALRRFMFSLGECSVHSVDVGDVEAYLDRLGGSPKSRLTWVGQISSFFSWAVGRGFCMKNPCDHIPKPIVVRGTPEILTVGQCQRLMESALVERPKLVPLIALCLFGGLRTGEAKDTPWSRVKLESGHITVDESTAKTRRRRIVPISENLNSWLQLGGDLPVSGRVDYDVNLIRTAAGITHWPRNVMRHSFCSYHLALYGSAAQTALAAGHSETMLFRHYREIVTLDESKRFWSIRPTTKENS